MESIDYIKWLVSYADVFEWRMDCAQRDYLLCPDRFEIYFGWEGEDFPTKQWISIYKPLLLQRVIEGINRKYPRINQGPCTISIENKVGDIVWRRDYKYFENIDQAKDAALKYIYKQENK